MVISSCYHTSPAHCARLQMNTAEEIPKKVSGLWEFSLVCYRWRKLGVGKSDDGLPRRHGRRWRRPHAWKLEPGQRNVAPAQRESARAIVARRDEASPPSARATPQPSPSPYARTSSAPATTASASRWLHATVLLVPG